jgi:hypothetical protein
LRPTCRPPGRDPDALRALIEVACAAGRMPSPLSNAAALAPKSIP